MFFSLQVRGNRPDRGPLDGIGPINRGPSFTWPTPHSFLDFLGRTIKKKGPSDLYSITGKQPPDLDRLAIDPGTIGAVQIRENRVTPVMNNLGMKTAYSIIVEPDGVTFLAPD
jgi:hypothetical protein